MAYRYAAFGGDSSTLTVHLARGVFVIFVLILEALSETSSVRSVQVKDLPFASNLLNPCPAASAHSSMVAEERRLEFAKEFYRTVADNSNRYKQDAQYMLERDAIRECRSLTLPNLPNTPTLTELQELEREEALDAVYSAVLLHAAHAYYIRYEHETSSNGSCTADRSYERRVARRAGELAVKQKFLACIVSIGAAAMGYATPTNATVLLDTRLTQQSLCSRRVLRDCQVLHSTVHLLTAVAGYAALHS